MVTLACGHTTAQAIGHSRPCIFVGCKKNLYLDVSPQTGALKLNFPDLEVWELAESCSLDVADGGGEILEAVGRIMNLTRERTRQLEGIALAKAHAAGVLDDCVEGERRSERAPKKGVGAAKRHLPLLR